MSDKKQVSEEDKAIADMSALLLNNLKGNAKVKVLGSEQRQMLKILNQLGVFGIVRTDEDFDVFLRNKLGN